MNRKPSLFSYRCGACKVPMMMETRSWGRCGRYIQFWTAWKTIYRSAVYGVVHKFAELDERQNDLTTADMNGSSRS